MTKKELEGEIEKLKGLVRKAEAKAQPEVVQAGKEVPRQSTLSMKHIKPGAVLKLNEDHSLVVGSLRHQLRTARYGVYLATELTEMKHRELMELVRELYPELSKYHFLVTGDEKEITIKVCSSEDIIKKMRMVA